MYFLSNKLFSSSSSSFDDASNNGIDPAISDYSVFNTKRDNI